MVSVPTLAHTFTALAFSTVCLRSSRKEASSDGVSILGTEEVTGFALGEPVKAVTEDFAPPSFEFIVMFCLQRVEGFAS